MRLSLFARNMLAEWRRLALPTTESPLLLAVSGGADSTALLLAVHELIAAGKLGVQVTVAHLDHVLPGDEEFAEFVATLAADHGFEFVVERSDVRARADATRDNLEQAARRSRYEFFGREARRRGARFVFVAHTLDDQAETILLRLLRGSGADGLGGMLALRLLVEGLDEAGEPDVMARIMVARPLLAWARRADTEDYCRSRGQEFLRDWINDDDRYARVRVRRDLLPLLRTFNPRIERTLARTARLLRDDAAALDIQAKELLDKSATGGLYEAGAAAVLDARMLAAAPAALQRRALRGWLLGARGSLRRLEETHIDALLSLLAGRRGGRVIELPGGGKVERRAGKLRFIN